MLLGSTTLVSVPALAQVAPTAGGTAAATPSAEPDATAKRGNTLEDIVVTARRREENVQKTPVAVTALSASKLAVSNITRLSGLSQAVPNLLATENPAASVGTNFFIRGVGATSGSLYADPTVALYVDGVIIPHGGGAAFNLPDVERIEVLRGPQGTLFGRNTTGGAISIFTNPPAKEAGGELTLGYGSDNEKSGNAVIDTGELGSSGLSAHFTADGLARDGWANSPGRPDSRSGGYQRSDDFSVAIHADLAPNLTADYRWDYSYLQDRPVWQVVAASPTTLAYYSQSASLGGAPFLISPNRLSTYYIDPRLPDSQVKTWGHELTLKYAVSDAFQLKSITAYRDLQQDLSAQISGSAQLLGRVANPVNPANPIEQVIPNETTFEPGTDKQFTQELQASGTMGDITYVAGFYYFREHINEKLPSVITSILANGLGFQLQRSRFYDLTSITLAGYGQASYKPSALDGKLELTGGLRYTYDKKDESEGTTSSIAPSVFLPERSNTWHNVGYSASVSYQWTPGFMTYGRIASSYKAGGYNPGDLTVAYDPEKALSFEVGFKTDLFDRRLRLNMAAFHTRYRDLQISQYDGANATNDIVNAGRATFDGVEGELTALLGHGFELDLNGGYVDPKYQQYLIKNTAGVLVNVANVARFPYVAKVTGSAGLQYQAEMGSEGKLIARADFAYRSTRYFHPLDQLQMFQEQVKSTPMHNLSASLTWSDIPVSSRVKLKAQVYGDNLLNQQYIVQGIDFGSLGLGVVSFARPRSGGIRLTGEF
jgi:iron complex outermembrane receptor protein